MYVTPTLRPIPSARAPFDPGIHRLADVPFSAVRGAPGSYLAERLAGVIEGWGRWPGCVWLRPQRTQAANLAGALAGACAHRWGLPEPAGRPAEQLTATLRGAPPGAVIVVELGGVPSPTVNRLLRHVRAEAMPPGTSLVVVVESRLATLALRAADGLVGTTELVDAGTWAGTGGPLDRHRDRLLELVGERAAVSHDVLEAAGYWPAEALIDAIDGSSNCRSLLDRVSANLLELATPAQLSALEVCASSDYWHPQLAAAPPSVAGLRPWVVPLEHGWAWLRPVWARALRRRLGAPSVRSTPPWHTAKATVAPRAAGQPARPPSTLEVKLLGPFELRFDGVAVGTRAGQRGTSVLRYLLSREQHSSSRDELLVQFWPNAGPDAGRNRLQVAISGLRRSLRDITNLNVICYTEGSYRINPELRVRVDVEQFDQALSAAARAERDADPDAALIAYRVAIDLYRGEFAADAPYEEWTLLPRESVRMGYLNALDRMSRIQLGRAELDGCIATAHRMLDADPCREDAHRLLMHCYARQGRIYRAVRQYEFCCRVLRATLETDPDPLTVRLYRSVKAGAPRTPALTG